MCKSGELGCPESSTIYDQARVEPLCGERGQVELQTRTAEIVLVIVNEKPPAQGNGQGHILSLTDDAIRYGTPHSFEMDWLDQSVVGAGGNDERFLAGPRCAHLFLNASDRCYERAFSVNVVHQDVAKALEQGMTLAPATACAEWESPAHALAVHDEYVIVPFPQCKKQNSNS